MQLESKSRNFHTRCGFISKHAVTPQKSISIRGSYIGKLRICVRFKLVKSIHCSIFVLVLGSSSTFSQHINHSGQDDLKFSFDLHYFGPDLRLAQTKQQYHPVSKKMQTADCRPGTKCRMRISTVFSSDT